ncbi:MAG: glycosyltransferase family 4 protein [Lachnospiraceae bacterium]|nr:glycosyltransferase family 4 protein [Lachnospiraceae bacterium]
MNTYRIALISMSDFEHLPPGGEVQLLHNLLGQAPPAHISLSLLGMSFSENMPEGMWHEIKIGENTYPFFPLCRVLKSKEKTRIPFRLRMVAGIRKYYKKAALADFDAIYVQAPETVLPLKKYRGKIALHVHTDPDQTLRISRFPLFRLPIFQALYTKRIEGGIDRADRIIWSADAIKKNYTGIRPTAAASINAKSVVVHASYDPGMIPGIAPMEFDGDVTYFITVGRLAKGKRVDRLIKAFALFLEKHPETNAGFIVCGGGEELENLKSLAVSLNVADKVHFTGDIGRPALAACLQHSRVFLFASASETMSLVVLESLYMGVPVVTSNVGDLHAAVKDGETGFVLDDPSPENYLAAVSQILSRPASEWSEKCRAMAECYSPARMNASVCEQLTIMLEQKPL